MRKLIVILFLGFCSYSQATDTYLRYSSGSLVVVDGVIQVGAASTSDLILEYLFDKPAFEDESLNNNNGVLSATPPVFETNAPSGKQGSWAFFTGNAAIGTTHLISTGTPFTVWSRCYLDDFATVHYPNICSLKSENTQNFQIGFSDNARYNDLYFGGQAGWTRLRAATTSFATAGWNTVAVLYNGDGIGTAGNFSAYINGTNVALTSAGGLAANSGNNIIGGGGYTWYGNLSDFAIYDVEKSASFITNLNSGTPIDGTASDVVAYWSMTNPAVIDHAVTSLGNWGATVDGADQNIVLATNGLTGHVAMDADDYILVADDDSLSFNIATNIRLSAWVERNVDDDLNGIISKLLTAGEGGGGEYALWFHSTGDGVLTFTMHSGGASADRWDATIPDFNSDDGINQISASYDGSGTTNGMKMYLNGISQSLTIVSGGAGFTNFANTTASVKIGSGESGIGELNGDLFLPVISSNVLSDAEELAANRTQAVTLGILSGWIGADTSRFSRTVANVNCNNNFQDYFGNSSTSGDLPALTGTPSIGWGSGNGVAEHLVITASSATNIMFTAGLTASVMTNYAVIDGAQYVNGSTQAFANVYYESTATSNVFWRYGNTNFYAGLISQIHCGTFTSGDASSLNTYINANIDWTP